MHVRTEFVSMYLCMDVRVYVCMMYVFVDA